MRTAIFGSRDQRFEGFGDADAKMLGAYYTDARAADFLTWWAIRSPQATVLDPSFGAGVFLYAASRRIQQLGGRPEIQVFGVEIDREVHAQASGRLAEVDALDRRNLIHSDFFRIDPAALSVDVVIGNPPFIRYQRFTGETRKRALARCRDRGVHLPELCSSWAPFLVHAMAMLRRGGRLAMVLPMEIGHAKYARPILEHLRRSFGSATFLTFRRKLFPELSEDTVLLLAEDLGASSGRFRWRDLAGPEGLAELRSPDHGPLAGTRDLDARAVAAGGTRLIESLIPDEARRLYHELKRARQAQRLGELADVGIGYVTGANEFFHLGPDEVGRHRIPPDFLKPAIRRGRALSGLRLTPADWPRAVAAKEAGYLLHIRKDQVLPEAVRAYLRGGELQRVPERYKCRTRSPWYCVPHVHDPDAFLSYMSGSMPRLVANHAGVYAPNSLHIVRFHPSTGVSSDALAALWQTSLTRLSVEIEGHALGGGMLKLEPTEAENVLVPILDHRALAILPELAVELDHLARTIGDEAARQRADQVILRDRMGLSRSDCALLTSAAATLRARRGYGEPVHGPA